jgi:hypothetical protein
MAAVQWMAPFAGWALGKWFRDNGKHALAIYKGEDPPARGRSDRHRPAGDSLRRDAGAIKVVGDIVEPIDVEWEANG